MIASDEHNIELAATFTAARAGKALNLTPFTLYNPPNRRMPRACGAATANPAPFEEELYGLETAAAERTRYDRLMRTAIKAGKIRPVMRCFCGLSAPGADIMLHLEDYTRYLEPIAICVECHMRLHKRFSQPNRWKLHCLRIRVETAAAYNSVASFFGASGGERADIAHVDFTPDPDRWWESLSLRERDSAPTDYRPRSDSSRSSRASYDSANFSAAARASSPENSSISFAMPSKQKPTARVRKMSTARPLGRT